MVSRLIVYLACHTLPYTLPYPTLLYTQPFILLYPSLPFTLPCPLPYPFPTLYSTLPYPILYSTISYPTIPYYVCDQASCGRATLSCNSSYFKLTGSGGHHNHFWGVGGRSVKSASHPPPLINSGMALSAQLLF